jgi:hypothetical protein
MPRPRRRPAATSQQPSPPLDSTPTSVGCLPPSAGVLAPGIARGAVVQLRQQCPSVKRDGTADQVGPLPRSPLTGTQPAAGRRLRSVAGRERAFGACCFAGKLRSPAGPSRAPRWPRTSTLTLVGTRVPTPATRVPLPARAAGSPWSCPSWGQSAAKTAADWPPSGGVERPRRKVRFARLIHRRVRALGRPSAAVSG